MNKSDLIRVVAAEAGSTPQKVQKVIDCFFQELSEGLKTEEVSIKDFGTFKKVVQKERVARNPATGAPVQVPEKEVLKFKASKNAFKMKWL